MKMEIEPNHPITNIFYSIDSGSVWFSVKV